VIFGVSLGPQHLRSSRPQSSNIFALLPHVHAALIVSRTMTEMRTALRPRQCWLVATEYGIGIRQKREKSGGGGDLAEDVPDDEKDRGCTLASDRLQSKQIFTQRA